MTPLAWLREIPESPSAAGIAAITERLAYVRAIGIDPAVTAAIHERRFDQYAREGAVAPAFLLSGYSVGRRSWPDATNLGLERMANASQGVTYAQLAWTHSWYLSEENYRAALAKVIQVHHAQPFAKHWGNGQASSSDGQFFRSGRRRGGAGEVNAKYGPEPGLRIYTHLSDMHGSFNTRVLSATASEAPYVLDGLVGRQGGEHYTDTGATDHVFALCHLLGYRFVPQMRDLQDRRLAIIGSAAGYKTLEPILGRPIRIDLIQENWDDIVRLAASIKAGAVAPSVMLKKLSAFKRQNRLDLALAEVGRIERILVHA